MKPGRRRLSVAAVAVVGVIVLTASNAVGLNAYARRSPVVACRLVRG
jgi:hypothetical protein